MSSMLAKCGSLHRCIKSDSTTRQLLHTLCRRQYQPSQQASVNHADSLFINKPGTVVIKSNRVGFSQMFPQPADTNIVCRHFSGTTGNKSLTLSRPVPLSDCNPLNMIHGGVMLQMIEEAGHIITTKYCNDKQHRNVPGFKPCFTTPVHIDYTQFKSHILVGEVAEVRAEIAYTSPHSLQVHITVVAKDTFTGKSRIANETALWYVPVAMTNVKEVLPVLPMEYASPEEEKKGLAAYEQLKAVRANTTLVHNEIQPGGDQTVKEPSTVAFGRATNFHLVMPPDCSHLGVCRGGTTMKWMDDVAGLAAIKYCQRRPVTVSIEAINFHRMINQGSVLEMTAWPTFTSDKMMEIQAVADVLNFEGGPEQHRVVEALFSFVAFSKEGKPVAVPQLKVKTDLEKELFEIGRQRYLRRRAAKR